VASYVVAVSGGVDSVVLLHMLVNNNLPSTTYHLLPTKFIVAHFDHGIRSESAADARFVSELASKYELPFETRREELGAKASEELARTRRYEFLRVIAKKHGAKIVTAHHGDDVIETIAINLIRGTGWRGLAVLDSPDIERPLLDTTKTNLIAYAKQHKLEWREDVTNQDTKYLRNDLRQKLSKLDDSSRQLLQLYRNRQVVLRHEVDNECKKLINKSPYLRHTFIAVPDAIALELLRTIFINEVGTSPTRPQLGRTLHAIKVFGGGKRYEVAAGVSLRFAKTNFVVEVAAKVVS
jgi:tRNA(Ile)-lysidine synthetase-like protein